MQYAHAPVYGKHATHVNFRHSKRKQACDRLRLRVKDEFSEMPKAKKKGKPQQPPSSVAESAPAESLTDEDVGKDFGTLVNAPLSKGGHFVFKSEKAWTVDSSEYSEFFTLNLKEASAAIDCVPFNEYVDVPDRYFVSDQLTSIYNDAERSKAAYSAILDELIKENAKTDQSKDMKSTTNVKPENNLDHLEKDPDSLGDIEEDLDFLLSLKEPLQSTVTEIAQPMSLSTSRSSDSKTKSKNIPNKSNYLDLELEKLLDSVQDVKFDFPQKL
ncbi:uncharacterized protein [Temnothorax nylanderi]|uniref:uncharacterized protein n=1 Tax=Temnothorax nylanderi TaxID=102681 RepID=UPI003A8783C7